MLTDPQHSQDLQTMKAAFLKRRNLVIGLLQKMPGVLVNEPQGAFYVFANVSAFYGRMYGDQAINNCDDLCDLILNEAHVALVPGSAFGNKNCIRLSYATSEEQLIEAIERINKFLQSLTSAKVAMMA
jgi:aspartate aminotransferase